MAAPSTGSGDVSFDRFGAPPSTSSGDISFGGFRMTFTIKATRLAELAEPGAELWRTITGERKNKHKRGKCFNFAT